MIRIEYRKKRKKYKKKLKAGIAVMGMLIAVILVVVLGFHIRNVEVVGIEQYSAQEIEERVINDIWTSNSLYLLWKYTSGRIEQIPFVSEIEIKLLSPGTVRIRVYEKGIVGYVEYMGANLYFDKDGIVVESSHDIIEGIPQITGLAFDRITLYQELPLEKKDVFNSILNLTQLMKKNEMTPEKININALSEITLYFENVKVLLGKDTDIQEKISRLTSILPNLEGLTGTLHMETFKHGAKNITFEKET